MAGEKNHVLESYNIINNTANSNSVIQGLSGLVGFPATIIADGAIIFTHYAPMLNNIRMLYNREPLSAEALSPVLKNITSEILFDVVVDKIAGHIPIIGIYFNAICAKALTWRLGILFSILSCLGEDVTDMEMLKNIIELIRNVFPQKDIFKFVRPEYGIYKKIMYSIDDNDPELFMDRVKEALKAFDI